jgi:hypothetical protein
MVIIRQPLSSANLPNNAQDVQAPSPNQGIKLRSGKVVSNTVNQTQKTKKRTPRPQQSLSQLPQRPQNLAPLQKRGIHPLFSSSEYDPSAPGLGLEPQPALKKEPAPVIISPTLNATSTPPQGLIGSFFALTSRIYNHVYRMFNKVEKNSSSEKFT